MRLGNVGLLCIAELFWSKRFVVSGLGDEAFSLLDSPNEEGGAEKEDDNKWEDAECIVAASWTTLNWTRSG
jgi:hypothetical protein